MKRPLLLVLALVFVMTGCGKEAKEEKDVKFRIPDSLLSPLDSYKLTTNDYHPVRGGVMANREIELQYPASAVSRVVAVKAFGCARDAYQKIEAAFGKPAGGRVYLIGTKDLDEYRFLTRKEWWYYGVVQGDTICFEPLDIMTKRGILAIGITQKIGQMALDRRSKGRIPLWLKEGMASRLAEEWPILKAQLAEFDKGEYDLFPTSADIEETLERADDRPTTRIAFYCAYVMVDRLLAISDGENVEAFIDLLGEGRSRDEASRAAFGMDYDSLLDRIWPDEM
jgi:hypothetical protein